MRRLSATDRRLGAAVRRIAAGVPHGTATARTVAVAMSPGFRIAVAALLARRSTRATGARALCAGVIAALTARALRDRLDRRRPGPRAEGGLPSRHAAASAAIVTGVWPREPAIGRAMAAAAVLGGLARVADAEHEPADILAGAVLGVVLAAGQERLLRAVSTPDPPAIL